MTTDGEKAKAAEIIYGLNVKLVEILPGVYVPEGAEWNTQARVTIPRDVAKDWVGSKGQ